MRSAAGLEIVQARIGGAEVTRRKCSDFTPNFYQHA
jgi:hypothetical protein